MLWQLFGTTNQLMAGLALLAVTIYLMRRGKPTAYTAVPMAFILASTLLAMVSNLLDFWSSRDLMLLITGGTVLVLALWLVVEAWLAVGRHRKHPVIEGMEVEFKKDTAQPKPANAI